VPRVSVLMPVHNGAPMLRISLQSALAQRFADFDVIVLGDGCTDDSERVALEAGDRRVRWVGFPKGPGYGYANRARALAAAGSELVAYLNADDLWAPDHLDRLVEFLDTERADLVFSRPVLFGPDGRLRPHYFPFDLAARGRCPAVGPRLYFVSGSQVLHTRAILDRAGGWDSGLTRFGDIDVWHRCRAAGGRVRYLPHPTSVRRSPIHFHGTGPAAAARLQRQFWAELRAGRLDLARERWPLGRRVRGWVTDLALVAWIRGPIFARSRAARWWPRVARPAATPHRTSES
jgi:glycosyltransferase involved in cell wall biosynthesis